MVKKKTINNNITELYYYNFYCLKIFNIFFYYRTDAYCVKFFIILKKFEYFKSINKFNFQIFNTKNINKYLSLNINKKFSPVYQISTNVENNFGITPLLQNKNKNKFLETKFFNLFFLFNYSLFNKQFKPNANFDLFYIKKIKNEIILINTKKFNERWTDAYNLLFNVFFYNLNYLLFGSPFFKKEILALNWNNNLLEINMWRYYFPFFIFKLNKHNKQVSYYLDKLNFLEINFYLITDCAYHYKNLYYLKKKNLYSVGLISINLNPWLIDYPIITFFENYITQLFFFKLMIFIQRQVFMIRFFDYKNIWFNFLFHKIFLLN